MNDYQDEGNEYPEEPTRPTSSTPVSPPQRPRREKGTPGAYSTPALPRQSRQSRPMPMPPPEPGRGIEDMPNYPPARRRPSAGPPRSKRESGLYLPWWSLVILLVFVGSVSIGAWAVVDTIGSNVSPGGQTPIVIVVTATFTVGPPPSQTPIPPPPTELPPAILPTVAPTPTLPPGNFVVGSTVEVVEDVGIAGLNIRSGPGLDSAVRYQAPPHTQFIIKSGPQMASGDEWWELQDVNDSTRGGWASRRYLQSVTTP